jgi:hypothetical protein
MGRLFEVSFTVFDDASQTSYQSNLADITTVVHALTTSQAQAMVEAQYSGRAKVWMVKFVD